VTEVGWATMPVIPSLKGFQGELDRQSRKGVQQAGAASGKRFGDSFSEGAGSRLKGAFSGLIPAVGVGVALGGLKSVIDTASSAEQAVGGVRAVFKDYADEVVKDSERAEQALGLSSTAYQELVTVSGALLKNKGLADFAQQAETLVSTGADLAAMFGGTTREAVEALNAALRGESDPIERYAISLNETAVNAELASRGASNLTGAALDQAKTQARLAIIQQQSTDAQGAFGREAATAAGRAARATAHWENMRKEMGENLLPAYAAFVGFLDTKAMPALESAGGVIANAVSDFRALPAPVQAAAASLVAFRVAQAGGLTGGVASRATSTLNSMRSGMDGLRLRTMLAADEFSRLRGREVLLVGESFRKMSTDVGRANASLGALRVGAQGAGTALRRGIGGAVSLVGGPWALALAGGAVTLAHFVGEHKKAKAEIEAFTGALDEQSGALTEVNQKMLFGNLRDSGAFEAAEELGIALRDIQRAAEGDELALARVNRVVQDVDGTFRGWNRGRFDVLGVGKLFKSDDAKAAITIMDALRGTNALVDAGKADWGLWSQASGQATRTAVAGAGEATAAMQPYADMLRTARGEVQKLLEKENERRNANLKDRTDHLALQQALLNTRKEVKEGAKTIDVNTQAGIDNKKALYDLAEQWNNSTPAARKAAGGFGFFRDQLITMATQMGYSQEGAKNLANQILQVPQKKAVKVETSGIPTAMQRLYELDRRANEATRRRVLRIDVAIPAANAAINQLNNMLGGLVNLPNVNPAPPPPRGGHPTSGQRTAAPLIHVENQTVQAHDYNDFLTQQQQRQRRAAVTGPY
jgi:hypothetical protein